jgi:serine/threonine-protein kinase
MLRQELGEDAIESTGDRIRLNAARITSDLADFEAGVLAGDFERAVSLYGGDYLCGFHVSGSAEFDEWAAGERSQLSSTQGRLLEDLAVASEAQQDYLSAAGWWEKLSQHDPFNSRAMLSWMRALVAAGDPGNAVLAAEDHEARLAEIGLPLPIEIRGLVDELRASPASVPIVSDRIPTETRADSDPSAGPPIPPTESRIGSWRDHWWMAAALAVVLVSWFAGIAPRLHRSRLPPKSVAVVPFMNLTGDSGFDRFADGVADELISALSRLPDLKVPAQTSSFHFRPGDLDVRAIGDSLGVEMVVEGSVRSDGDRVRVTVQLIDATSGYHLWTETFDRHLSRWMEAQQEVARSAIHAMQLSMPEDWVPPSSTGDVDAWRDYQKGLYWWRKRTPMGTDSALVFLRRAIAADSGYSRAWAALANAYITGMYWQHVPRTDSVVHFVWSLIDTAERLDPGLPDAVVSRAGLLFDEGELEASEREFQRAIQMNPNSALAHQWYVDLLGRQERRAKQLEEARLAYQLNPMSPIAAKILGDVLRSNLLLEEALIYWRYSIDLAPGHWSGHANMARTLTCLGRFEEAEEANRRDIEIRGESDHAARNLYLARDYAGALALIERLRVSDPAASAELASRVYAELGDWNRALEEYRVAADQAAGDAYTNLIAAYIYARMGEKDRARAILVAPGEVEDAPSVYWNAAAVHGILGDFDRAFELLERAYRGRMKSVMTLAVNPRYESLRADPRFEEFLIQIGLPVAR